MKHILAITLIVLLASGAHCKNIGYADNPLDIGIGAKAMGIGRAAIAASNETNSIFINPAGLSRLTSFGLTSMQVSLLGGDIHYFVIGVSNPLSKDYVLGVGYVTAATQGIISPTQEGFNYSDFSNNTILVSIGRQVNKKLSIGASLKYFKVGYQGYINFLGTGQDIDLGAKYKHNDNLDLGLVLSDILPYELGGKIIYPNNTEQGVPAAMKAGFRYTLDNLDFYYSYDLNLEKTFYPNLHHLGIEFVLDPMVTLRGGLDQTVNAAAAGGVYSNPTFGVGLNLSRFKIDYAYHPYFTVSANVSHYISIGYVLPDKVETKKATMESPVRPWVIPPPARPSTIEMFPLSEPEEPEITAPVKKKAVKKYTPPPKKKVVKKTPAPVKKAAQPAKKKEKLFRFFDIYKYPGF